MCGAASEATFDPRAPEPLRRGSLRPGAPSHRAASSQVFRGQKVFYLIKPTPENLKAYEAWICDAKQDSTFFPDTVGGSA